MPKSYGQFCGIAKALDIVGERWTLLLIRDLLLGPRRFSDLITAHPGLTPALLSTRLKALQLHGLVDRQRLPAPAASWVYGLTELGRELEPALLALGRFGSRWLAVGSSATDRVDPRWAMGSLKRRYVGSAHGLLHLIVGELPFTVCLAGSEIDIQDGRLGAADVAVEGALTQWMAWFQARSHALTAVGDGALFEALRTGW